MSEKLKQMRAAKRAAKENSQREMDKLDRELCKAFSAAESAGGTRPAPQRKEKDIFAKYPGGFEMAGNLQQVSTDSDFTVPGNPEHLYPAEAVSAWAARQCSNQRKK